ncbi:SMI1/KNR4 family protein [Deinococcus peraridilitoris]|uniref:Protein involved in beta-1,3-glucan synthesis n=1 Tax=Deinococcus peraridilitoris (strain DSM 19664 / LMG 22246 / CIP 109416 / KR-200) TaxID=937777 RepID=L0A363_DEIPD|nr:SMI1/KNR4 family protein [Deinococcus peraridilitoris]AFZ68338.1 protein involved in beta-1,3-glucan synthesis [Deinococcus peraridilitoris DSM 19664]
MTPTTVQLWHVLIEAIERIVPGTHLRLNGPASEHDLVQLEERIGFPLPADVRAIYKVNNGEADDLVPGVIFNLKFLPIREVLRLIHGFQELRESGICEEGDVPDDRRLRIGFPSVTLVPFLDDTTGNQIGYDVNPGPLGRAGQIVVFGADYEEVDIPCTSITECLTVLIEQIQNGNYVVENEPYCHYSGMRLKDKSFSALGKVLF